MVIGRRFAAENPATAQATSSQCLHCARTVCAFLSNSPSCHSATRPGARSAWPRRYVMSPSGSRRSRSCARRWRGEARAVPGLGLTNGCAHKVRRMKLTEDLKRGSIKDSHLLPFHGNQSVTPQFGKHAIDMGRAEPDDVADAFLGQRHDEGIGGGTADRLEPRQHLQNEVREPLEWFAPSCIDSVLGIHRRLPGSKPNK